MNPDPILRDAALARNGPLAESEPAVHQVHRRPLGIHPVPLLGGLGSVGLLLALVLLVGGSGLAGLILLGISIALLVLFFGGVRREPDTPVARLVFRVARRMRALGRLLAVGVRVRGRAGIDLIRIRRRQQRLRSELRASLAPLGEAVHQGDQPRAQVLKRQAADIEQMLSETEREASAVILAARRDIEQERATIDGARSPAQPR